MSRSLVEAETSCSTPKGSLSTYDPTGERRGLAQGAQGHESIGALVRFRGCSRVGTSHSRDAVVGAGLLVHVLVLVGDEALEGLAGPFMILVLILQPEERASFDSVRLWRVIVGGR